MKNTVKIFIFFIAFMLLSGFCVGAESAASMPDEFGEIAGSLPDGVRDSLPDEMLDPEHVHEGLSEVLSVEYIFEYLGDRLQDGLSSALRLACILIGLVIISALARALVLSVESPALGSSFRMCSSLALFSAVIGIEISQLERIAELLDSLNELMGSMIPVTGVIWAMGGNVSTASTGSATLYVFLSMCESLCAKTVLPVCLILTVVALSTAISPDLRLGGVSGAVKKTYNFVLGLVMTLLVSVLGLQTTLTSSADGIGAKTAKLVSSTVIPIVGGSVGDTLRSVAGSAQYIKSVFGISAIVFILFLVLPTLISILLSRAVFVLTGGVADMLGCDQESRLLGEIGNIYGCMLGVVSMSAVMFILGFAIFVKSAVAIA